MLAHLKNDDADNAADNEKLMMKMTTKVWPSLKLEPTLLQCSKEYNDRAIMIRWIWFDQHGTNIVDDDEPGWWFRCLSVMSNPANKKFNFVFTFFVIAQYSIRYLSYNNFLVYGMKFYFLDVLISWRWSNCGLKSNSFKRKFAMGNQESWLCW